jgi:succinoglycan biosynthesis protein ExoV
LKIHQISNVNGNFGDELNGWMWRELYPELFNDGHDDNGDGIDFIGIGTILDRHLPTRGLNVVLGSGTGYAPPPDLRTDPAQWCVYGVRGPLTAQLLDLPREAVLTDPAILLADHPRWRGPRPESSGGADDASGKVIFVPHWKSIRFGQWQAACELAHIDFVDPCGDAREVIDRIAGARLVVAESMHAAIIADALRVPWVPVVLSREVAPFKWADWAATVGLEYTPLLLSPSSPVEVLRAEVLEHSAFSYISDFGFQARADGGPRELGWSREQLLHDHAQSIEKVGASWRWHASIYAEALLKRLARIAPDTHQRIAPGTYQRYRDQAAAQLTQAANAPSFLSGDAAHRRALQRCQEAVARLAADRREGRLAAWARSRTASSPQVRELAQVRVIDTMVREPT